MNIYHFLLETSCIIKMCVSALYRKFISKSVTFLLEYNIVIIQRSEHILYIEIGCGKSDESRSPDASKVFLESDSGQTSMCVRIMACFFYYYKWNGRPTAFSSSRPNEHIEFLCKNNYGKSGQTTVQSRLCYKD